MNNNAYHHLQKLSILANSLKAHPQQPGDFPEEECIARALKKQYIKYYRIQYRIRQDKFEHKEVEIKITFWDIQ